MLSSYTNQETIVYKKEEETSNISKENSNMKNNNMVLLNSNSVKNKNGGARESITEFRKRLHLSNEQFDEFVKVISQKNPFNLVE